MLRNWRILLGLLLGVFCCQIKMYSQTILTGKVVDAQQQPVLAANVYLQGSPAIGTTTDYEGTFVLQLPEENYRDSTLVVSYLGFETQKLQISERSETSPIHIVLTPNQNMLDAIILEHSNPISEQFSVARLKTMDIYLNPQANGDPLKAITGLPASTNVNENASPTLRGSSPERSQVMLNGVPVLNPIKNSQVNSVGNFSLFNPEIIAQQYVYASNPPLTYGNTSAGLVEIETIDSLQHNQLHAAAGLANVGVLLSQKTNSNDFIQLYSNGQFSDAFVALNAPNYKELDYFENIDLGLNYRMKLNAKTKLNFFSYSIHESYGATTQNFTYTGKIRTSTFRNFNIMNFNKTFQNGMLTLNGGLDYAIKNYHFGNIDASVKEQQGYASANYKHLVSNANTLQTGITYSYNSYGYENTIPEFFFAQAPEAPTIALDNTLQNHAVEAYLYDRHVFSNQLSIAAGIRTNLPTKNQSSYLSHQTSLRYTWNQTHSVLFSTGQYFNYSLPIFFDLNYKILKSHQTALDYSFTKKSYGLNAAIYYKDEAGDLVTDQFIAYDKTKIFGIEILGEFELSDALKFSISNTYIDKQIRVGNNYRKAADKLNYFIKASLSYTHSKLPTLSLSYIGRSGTYFTPVTDAVFNEAANAFSPNYASTINETVRNDYSSINVNANKLFSLQKNTLITYVTLNNALNSKNQRVRRYAKDYTSFTHEYLQPFTIYFGVLYKFY